MRRMLARERQGLRRLLAPRPTFEAQTKVGASILLLPQIIKLVASPNWIDLAAKMDACIRSVRLRQ